MNKKFIYILLLLVFMISASRDYIVYITPKGKKYHTEYCQTIKNKKIKIKKTKQKSEVIKLVKYVNLNLY